MLFSAPFFADPFACMQGDPLEAADWYLHPLHSVLICEKGGGWKRDGGGPMVTIGNKYDVGSLTPFAVRLSARIFQLTKFFSLFF